MENINPLNDEAGISVTAPAATFPKILKLESLAIILLLFLIFKIAISLLFKPVPNSFASDLTPENILSAINKERTMRNLAALNTNFKLSSAAQSKADDMIARHYFSHIDPEGNYIWDKIVAAGYSPYLQLGENLAIEFSSTESLVSAWMNSPTHRANILQEGFKDQGMGLDFGNSSLEQYHSAIVNTFGALLVKAQKTTPPPPAPTPKPAPQPAPKPATPAAKPAPISTPTPAPVQIADAKPAATQNSTSSASLKPRDSLEQNSTQAKSPTTTATAKASTADTTQSNNTFKTSADAVIPQNLIDEAQGKNSLNRYFVLGLGIVVLYFLLADAKVVLQKKLANFDRKINNITILIISLIVIALMYFA